MHDRVEKKVIVVVIDAKRPLADLCKDRAGKVDTKHAFDLPHQVSANSKASDLASDGSVKRLVEIVAGMQPDIGVEPVILS